VVVRIKRRNDTAVLAEALVDADVNRALLDAVRSRRSLKGINGGRLLGRPTPVLRAALDGGEPPEPSVFRAEQSNTSVMYGQSLIMKLFRRVEDGVNPDLELGRYLGERAGYANTPPVAGALEYHADGGEPATLAIVHRFVPNEGDSWQYTIDVLGRFLERSVTERIEPGLPAPDRATETLLDRALRPVPEEAAEMVGSYLDSAALMGRRVAELHAALAADTVDPALAPEPFTPHYQRGLYQSLRNLTGRAMQLLKRQLPKLSDEAAAHASLVLGSEKALLARFQALTAEPLQASRIRCHGDLHLGQILFTGRDFMIIDFEGEPARSLGDRRVKRSPLRDVAGVLRSFHYATFTALIDAQNRGLVEPASDAAHQLEDWGRAWCDAVSEAFLGAYLAEAGDASWIPEDRDGLHVLLDTSLLEKAVYELTYELNNRPAWVSVALLGIADLVGAEGAAA
jgi:maltose alpha-D-glucosyltransferase/alpha-amylase